MDQPKRLSPSQVAELVEITPDMLRDWRRRGLGFSEIGQRDANGRWSFSPVELARMAIMKGLSAIGIDLDRAFRMTQDPVFRRAFIQHWKDGSECAFAIPPVKPDQIRVEYQMKPHVTFEALGRELDAQGISADGWALVSVSAASKHITAAAKNFVLEAGV